LKYLGIDIVKPRLAVFDFTGCEGCELQLVNKEETLVDFLSLFEVVNFREASSDKSDAYDIALIEGCISRQDEVERLKAIRGRVKILVALGSCACCGGVNHLKNGFPIEDVVRQVYGDRKIETEKVRSLKEVVQVDLEIPGCPVSKAEVERIVIALVTGAEIRMPKYPVCVECRQQLNTCLFDFGEICLGPITLAGCGAVCPSGKVGCRGCRGPADDANYESFIDVVVDKGFTEAEIRKKIEFFNAFEGPAKDTIASLIQKRIKTFNAFSGVRA